MRPDRESTAGSDGGQNCIECCTSKGAKRNAEIREKRRFGLSRFSEEELPGQDLNLKWLDQNQLCYQLHHRVSRCLNALKSGR